MTSSRFRVLVPAPVRAPRGALWAAAAAAWVCQSVRAAFRKEAAWSS